MRGLRRLGKRCTVGIINLFIFRESKFIFEGLEISVILRFLKGYINLIFYSGVPIFTDVLGMGLIGD